jgi:uncharacterized protein
VVAHGAPGSYLSIDRVWSNGDNVTFELPTASQPVLIQYPHSGIDNIKGSEGRRYALKVGPIVLPCVGKLDSDATIVLPLDPARDPAGWLVPVPGSPLHFRVKGMEDAVMFKPSWSIAVGENFTTYPVFNKSK